MRIKKLFRSIDKQTKSGGAASLSPRELGAHSRSGKPLMKEIISCIPHRRPANLIRRSGLVRRAGLTIRHVHLAVSMDAWIRANDPPFHGHRWGFGRERSSGRPRICPAGSSCISRSCVSETSWSWWRARSWAESTHAWTWQEGEARARRAALPT